MAEGTECALAPRRGGPRCGGGQGHVCCCGFHDSGGWAHVKVQQGGCSGVMGQPVHHSGSAGWVAVGDAHILHRGGIHALVFKQELHQGSRHCPVRAREVVRDTNTYHWMLWTGKTLDCVVSLAGPDNTTSTHLVDGVDLENKAGRADLDHPKSPARQQSLQLGMVHVGAWRVNVQKCCKGLKGLVAILFDDGGHTPSIDGRGSLGVLLDALHDALVHHTRSHFIGVCSHDACKFRGLLGQFHPPYVCRASHLLGPDLHVWWWCFFGVWSGE